MAPETRIGGRRCGAFSAARHPVPASPRILPFFA
jgi:hypothetical protein